MSYKIPTTIWELGSQLSFEEPLDADDTRFVYTESARGEFSFNALLKPYGIDPKTDEMKFVPTGVYSLFCGHRGCGKSTELRRLRARLDRPELFYVVFLDALKELDINNLSYADVLLAQAKTLIARIEQDSLTIDKVHLSRLEKWFSERIEKHEKTKDFAAEIKAGVKAKSGIPFLGELFAQMTSSFRIGSTYKEEFRTIIRNSFTEFSLGFQQLIDAANDVVTSSGKGDAILFIVDGTDRLSGEDSDNFFIRDAHQLLQIRGNFIYCAPIHLIYENNQVQQIFANIFKLPMIKIEEKYTREENKEGFKAMRDIIYKRADKSLFDCEETVNFLISNSGGHPRDLLHLLIYAFKKAEGELLDRASAEAAVKELATDYRRTLSKEDFQLLCDIDSYPDETHNTEEVRNLLYHLALLEYNAYWWRSHPAVRTLTGYRECRPTKDASNDTDQACVE
jgi:hypothetical protein